MDIKELYSQVNDKHVSTGKGKLTLEQFIVEISVMEYQGKIKLEENGEIAVKTIDIV